MGEFITSAFESMSFDHNGWFALLVRVTFFSIVGGCGYLVWATAKLHLDGPEIQVTFSSIGQSLIWLLVPVGGALLCNLSLHAENGSNWIGVELDCGQMSSPDSTVQITGQKSGWLLTYSGPDGQLGTHDDIVVTDLSDLTFPRALPITKT